MPNRRPLVLVTGPDRGGGPAWWCTRLMIWLGGGRARRISPSRQKGPLQFDALVLGGGADIHPSRYRQELMPELKSEMKKAREGWSKFFAAAFIWILRRSFGVKKFTSGIDVARDRLEWDLLKHAAERKIPVLGICRGCQLINVYFGGSLHQDISNFYVETPHLRTVRARKWINVENDCQLSKSLIASRTRVNSLHRQSVDSLGEGLRITAREPIGIVQAIEHPGYPFMVGVQWHPEFLPFVAGQRRLFHSFICAALKNKGPAYADPLPLNIKSPTY
jgi:putative glutamine amidotransferase